MANVKTAGLWAAVFFLGIIACDEKKEPGPEPEPLPRLLIADKEVPEGDEQHLISYAVTVTGGRKEEVSLSYETRDGSAKAELDYVPAWGELRFPPGASDSTQTISIKIYGNKFAEEDEFFELHFFNIKNAEPSDTSAKVTLLNDDVPPDTFPGYTSPLAYEGMKLIWQDEFEVAFHHSNWVHAIGTGCPNLCGWGNNQLRLPV